jgi:hypothetical protein
VTVELIAEPPYDDVLFVAQSMRPSDRAEIFATQWTDTPDELAAAVVNSGAFRWGAYIDGVPVAMIGAAPRWPGSWQAWAFGTNEFPRVARTLTRHARRFMQPALINAGARRMDAYALASHAQSNLWLRALGATPGNVLENWGKQGETFVCFTWLRKDNAAPATAVDQPEKG